MYVDGKIVLESYLPELPPWKKLLKDKWLLFDSSAIISIIHKKCLCLLDELINNNTTLVTIDPVVKELMATNSANDRNNRLQILQKMEVLYIDQKVIEKSRDVQELLFNFDCYPEPTDLYLAGYVEKIESKDKFFLATSNISHFPFPVFKRETGIVIQGSKNVSIVSILKLDKEPIEKETTPF